MRAVGSLSLMLVCSVMALSGSVVAIAAGQEAGGNGAAKRERRAIDRVRETLSEPIDSRFEAMPLREFAKRMSQQYGMEVRLDEPAIRNAGISLDLHLSNGFSKLHEETRPLRKQIDAGPEREGSLFGRVLKTVVGE